MKTFKKNPLMNMFTNSLISLPTPSNITIMWNFGSLLGFCLTIQIITGLFLTMHYCPNIEIAFNSIAHTTRDVNFGWLIRTLHANGASFFFMCLYMHIGRGIYYSSFNMKKTWMTGVSMFFITMATAFLGYVLPWGQMSFWGATVITNLISAIPYLGMMMVHWIWGGFAIDNATLNRFYSFHFLLPFILIALIMIHLIFLHEKGSTNPLGSMSNMDKIMFHPFFTMKDLLGFIIMSLLLLFLTLYNPYFLGDPDNFTPANPLSTPIHIKPEWYFLFAYAILRSIPNKFGGVIALMMSISILYLMPFMWKSKMQSSYFYPMKKIFFWNLLNNIVLLTWIGARPVEDPFILIGQMLTIIYFLIFLIIPISNKIWDNILFK